MSSHASTNPELIFSDCKVGKKFRPLVFEVTPTYVEEFQRVVGDYSPLYEEEKIAPPGIAAIYARLSYLQDHVMPPGGVLAKQEFIFKKEIEIGDTLTVRAEVSESYEDEKKRKRVNFAIVAENQKNEIIANVNLYAIWPK